MPSSTETYREELARLQARTLQALIAGEETDGAWMTEHLERPHPIIIEENIRPIHGDNLADAVEFFLPKFVAKAPIADWAKLSPYLPSTRSDEYRLEHFTQLAFSAVDEESWADLIRIEWAEYRQRNGTALATPDLVAKVRGLDALDFDANGRMETEFGSFVELKTTWFDVHWISGHTPANAVVFGPPRTVFFYRTADGTVRSVVFDSLDSLAVTLCFG
jgi:hypothetical protein